MSWKNILKVDRQTTLDDFEEKPYPSMEDMIRELWKDWLGGLESYEEYNYEQYSDGSDSKWSRLFTKLTRPLYKLDPINDADKIMEMISKLRRHPDMPLETLGSPTVGLEHAEEDVRNEYESIGEY